MWILLCAPQTLFEPHVPEKARIRLYEAIQNKLNALILNISLVNNIKSMFI
jgi:hypothetical protein